MRQLLKNQHEIWISIDDGTGNYGEPFLVKGTVVPRTQFLTNETALVSSQLTDICRFDRGVLNKSEWQNVVRPETSHFWIRRTPDEEQLGSDYTHVYAGGDTSAGNTYDFIYVKSVDGYNPFK